MESFVFVILWMIFFHIVDDYYLQKGWLSQAKQKKYWQENAPEEMYKYDYIWVLIVHSFSWTFMIMLPVLFVRGLYVDVNFLKMFAVNLIIHAVIDDLKANRRKLNLWEDQIIHIIQIVMTAAYLL